MSSTAKYIVFDPESADESVYYCDQWDDTFEDIWDAGHVEIIDIKREPPMRYTGNGNWAPLTHWIQVTG
jgi:hypothetical protein